MDTPSDRREPKGYEPPPWEREQPDEPEQQEADPDPARDPVQAPDEFEPEGEGASSGPNEAQMDAMIIGLSAEERGQPTGNVFVWSMGVAVFVSFLGVVFSVYAVVVFARTYEAGPLALAGSTIVGMMGLMLLASAVWLGVRTYNNRGV